MTKKDRTYVEFYTLPEWTRPVWTDGEVANAADPRKWSGKKDPPKIGENVKIYMNGLGTGNVHGYFAEHGWFGVLVKLDNPPAWWLKQNPERPLAHLFGIDLEPAKR